MTDMRTKVSKQLLGMIIAIIIIITSFPVAFAAETLKVANVKTWPTLTYKNEDGVIHFGQKLVDTVAVNDDEVVLDASGKQVAGHFEFVNPNLMPTPTSSEQMNSNLKFVPDDQVKYKGFTKIACTNVKYNVEKTMPLYVDEENDPIIATSIDPGEKITSSILSGGKMYNPYNLDEPKIAATNWEWNDLNQIVTESGYYEALFLCSGYEKIVRPIWIEVTRQITETEVKEIPVIDDITYDGTTTFEDLILKGGVAVEKGTDIPVPGTFAIKWTGKIDNIGTYDVPVTFTPDDTEKYLGCETTVTMNVNKPVVAWKDSETPTVTMKYGTEIRNGQLDVDNKLLNAYTSGYRWYFKLYDSDMNPIEEKAYVPAVGTYNYYVHPSTPYTAVSKNWDNTDVYLPITIVVEPEECAFKNVYYSYFMGEISSDLGSVYLDGTVDITVNGEQINGVEVKDGKFKTKWSPKDKTKNAEYDIKVVYNPGEKDNATVKEPYEGTIVHKGDRIVTVGKKGLEIKHGSLDYQPDPDKKTAVDYIAAGDQVSIYAVLPDFRYWVITDSKGNPVELEFVKGDKNTNKSVFIMPDYPINIDYVCQFELDNQAKIDECECLCHSDNQFVQFFWRIFYKIIEILNKLGADIKCRCGFPHGTNSAY